jgi:PAS domain-containing protein
MTARNREIQATHQILRLLEASKEQVDDTLDSLPCVFAVINSDGRVLKGNEQLGDLLGVEKELTLNQSLAKLFRPQSWNIFAAQLQTLSYVSTNRAEFELALDSENLREAFAQPLPYFWRVRKVILKDSSADVLFNVVGNDISELKRKEARLAEIYSSIPLGILSVDATGHVVGEHSAHLNWLLEANDVAGRGLEELLFEPCRGNLTEDERAAVQKLFTVFGGPEADFFALRALLPSELRYPLPQSGGDRFVGVSYQPVVHDGLLQGMFLILEDRTRLVVGRLERERAEREERARLVRLGEVKSCRTDLLGMTLSGLTSSLRDLEEATKRADARRMSAIIRKIVSLSEIASFSRVQREGVAALREVEPLAKGAVLAFPERLEFALAQLQKECTEYASFAAPGAAASTPSARAAAPVSDETSVVVRSLFDRYSKLVAEGNLIESALVGERIALALDSFNFMPIADIENFVRAEIASSAADFAREVKVQFRWEGPRVDEPTRLALFDVLLPLVRACVAEGFEYAEERMTMGKPRECALEIHVRSEFGSVFCQVTHDGRTIGSDTVLRAAVQTERLKFADTSKLNEDAILQLIFEPEIMKRTVGRDTPLLHAVAAVTRHEGQLRAEALKGNAGMRLSFNLRAERKSTVLKSCLVLEEFFAAFESSLRSLEASVGCRIKADIKAPRNRILLADRQRILLSLTTLLGSFSHACEVELEVTAETNSRLKFLLHQRVPKAASEGGRLPPEFELTLGLCEDYILQHDGHVERGPDRLVIYVGQLLGDDVLPRVLLDFDATIMGAEQGPLRELVTEAAREMGLKMSSSTEDLWGAKSMKVTVTRGRASGGGFLNLSGATGPLVRRELLQLVKTFLGFEGA